MSRLDRLVAVFELAEVISPIVKTSQEVYPDDIVQQALMLSAACSMANLWQELVPSMTDDAKADAVRALMEGFNEHAMNVAVRLAVPVGKYSAATEEITNFNPEGN